MAKADRSGLPAQVHVRDDKFIISCAARTGSTMLQQLLRSHPDILCHGEVIQPTGVGPLAGRFWALRSEDPGLDEWLWAYLSARPKIFLYDIVFERQGRQVVGFKFKTDEAYDGRWSHANWIQSAVTDDKDIKIVRLRRRDLLAQYVSHQVVLRQTKLTQIASDDQRPTPEPFVAERDHVLEYFARVAARERRADSDFASHRQFFVDYEDLVDGGSAPRDALMDFLGVRREGLETDTKKVLGDTRALLQNRIELLPELEEAGYPDGCYPPDGRYSLS